MQVNDFRFMNMIHEENMRKRLLLGITLSCISLLAQNDNSAESRLNFAEGISRRYKTTGADKELGYCIVAGPENRTIIHVIPGIKFETAKSLVAHKRLHKFLIEKGFTKIEFKVNSTATTPVILGANVTATGLILYNSTTEIPLQE